MADPLRCTSCGSSLDTTVARRVDHGKIVKCGLCQPRKYDLSQLGINDREFLRKMRIKVD